MREETCKVLLLKKDGKQIQGILCQEDQRERLKKEKPSMKQV